MRESGDKAVWKTQGKGMYSVGVRVRNGMIREE